MEHVRRERAQRDEPVTPAETFLEAGAALSATSEPALGVLHVRRRFTQGVLKDGGKTEGSTRTVPLRRSVLDALDAMPTRIDTPVLFPALRGGRIDLEKFRHASGTPRSAPPG